MEEEGQMVEKPFERKPLKFRFPELERSGRTVVEIKNMGFRYDDKVSISPVKHKNLCLCSCLYEMLLS